jgi:hypothetical protein
MRQFTEIPLQFVLKMLLNQAYYCRQVNMRFEVLTDVKDVDCEYTILD